MSACWPRIQGKTALWASETQHAKNAGARPALAAGLREQGPTVVAETARIRRRAYMLLAKAYEEVRRAVAFPRRKEHDADMIAPTFYKGRGRGKGAAADTASADTATDPVPTPVVGSTNGVLHMAPAVEECHDVPNHRCILATPVAIDSSGPPRRVLLPAHHLVTHGVIVGMTGSGKTGLVMVTAEEALRANVPVLMIDIPLT